MIACRAPTIESVSPDVEIFARADAGFPLILWGVEPPYAAPLSQAVRDEELDSFAATGFRWIQTYGGVKYGGAAASVADFLDDVARHHMRVIASVERIKDASIDTVFLAETVNRWKHHPAIGAWLTVDEPDVKRLSASDLATAYRICKKLDPSRPVVVVWAKQRAHRQIETYGPAFDWAMIDIYPMKLAGHDTSAIRSGVTELRSTLDLSSRPLTPIVQAFGDSRYLLPQAEDVESMMSEFADVGASYGVAFYAWNPPGLRVNLGQTSLWPGLQALTRRLRHVHLR